ncbi:MAG: hypothetical protein Q3971_07350 [Moraxella sp.]|nr:hypothetical protein [Moraxella sp.]
MNLNTVKDMASQLNRDDKLRLASLLIQMALTDSQSTTKGNEPQASDDYRYCLERIRKSRPARLPALENYLEAILSFKGSTTTDIKDIITELQQRKAISLDGEKVIYLTD